jgi:hypothetical protein
LFLHFDFEHHRRGRVLGVQFLFVKLLLVAWDFLFEFVLFQSWDVIIILFLLFTWDIVQLQF